MEEGRYFVRLEIKTRIVYNLIFHPWQSVHQQQQPLEHWFENWSWIVEIEIPPTIPSGSVTQGALTRKWGSDRFRKSFLVRSEDRIETQHPIKTSEKRPKNLKNWSDEEFWWKKDVNCKNHHLAPQSRAAIGLAQFWERRWCFLLLRLCFWKRREVIAK